MRQRFAILFSVIAVLMAVRPVTARPIAAQPVVAQETPQGIEVVLVLDTSGALLERIEALCAGLNKDVPALQARGFDLTVAIYGIAKPYACATQTVTQLPNSTVATDSDWGAAIADIPAHYPWRANRVRVIIPFSNRGPALGDPVNDPGPDRDVIVRAIAIAQTNKVTVSPLVGASDKATQPDDYLRLQKLATDLATATSGRVEVLPDAQTDPTLAVFRLIGAAAGTSGGAPMLSIPGAVRTLTCQRDVIKCVSFNPAVVLTNGLLAIVITSMLGLSQRLLAQSLALLRRTPSNTEAAEEAGRLNRLRGNFVRAANVSATTVTRSVRAN